MRIAKHFETLKKAEAYHQRLLGRHRSVRCIHWPRDEAGTYIWLVG